MNTQHHSKFVTRVLAGTTGTQTDAYGGVSNFGAEMAPFCYDWVMNKTVTCVDVNGERFEVPASDLQWRPSVYGIVVKDSKILLSRQFGEKYDLPGGGLDLGESPEDGVVREIKEETGINAKNPQLVDVKNSYFQSSHSENKSYHSLMIYYYCEYAGGELSTEGFDEYEKEYADMAEWVPLDKLGEIGLASTVDYRPLVREALKSNS